MLPIPPVHCQQLIKVGRPQCFTSWTEPSLDRSTVPMVYRWLESGIVLLTLKVNGYECNELEPSGSILYSGVCRVRGTSQPQVPHVRTSCLGPQLHEARLRCVQDRDHSGRRAAGPVHAPPQPLHPVCLVRQVALHPLQHLWCQILTLTLSRCRQESVRTQIRQVTDAMVPALPPWGIGYQMRPV